jgi:hypothetical protein
MPLTPEEEVEIAGYPDDVQALIRDIDTAHEARFQRYIDNYGWRETLESGHVVQHTKDGALFGDCPADYWFSLSYASWLTIPRLSLQEMPVDWQARFFRLLEEGFDKHGLQAPDGIYVMRRVGGRFVSNDHWNNYRRGTVAGAMAIDEAHVEPR